MPRESHEESEAGMAKHTLARGGRLEVDADGTRRVFNADGTIAAVLGPEVDLVAHGIRIDEKQ